MRDKIKRVIITLVLLPLRGLHQLIRLIPSNKGDEVVILALKRIGDTVLMLPALKEYLKYQSSSQVVIVCHTSNADIIRRYVPGVTCLIPDRSDLFRSYPIPGLGFLKRVRSRNTRLIIDATGDYSSTPYLFFNRTNDIIGANLIKYKFLYSRFIPIRTTPHLHDLYFDIFKDCDARISRDFHGFPSKKRKILTIGMNPSAGWSAKQWSTNRFIALARLLQSKYSIKWIIQPGSLHDDYYMALKLEGIAVTETSTVDDLLKALSEVDLFIGNDSGPIHLAALAGVSTFAIYGPTNPDYIKPVGNRHGFVRTTLPCIPLQEHYCFTDAGYTCPSFECMAMLTVNEVFTSLRHFIERLDQINNE